MKIIFWSSTGNTEEMANLIAKGIKEEGKVVEVQRVSDIEIDEVRKESLLILGCPSMGDEVLDDSEFEPFIESISSDLNGVKVALFGSYGWGDGQWMRDWEDKMMSYGCDLIVESLIVNYTPEGDDIDNCIRFGKEIATI